MNSLLLSKGWEVYYSCFCGGTKKEYWRNKQYPGYEIRVRPVRQTFSLFLSNQLIHGPNYGYNLENKLKEYGIIS
jgi:hypothetical protein